MRRKEEDIYSLLESRSRDRVSADTIHSVCLVVIKKYQFINESSHARYFSGMMCDSRAVIKS